MAPTPQLSPPLSSQRFEAVEAHVRHLVDMGALPHAEFLAARDGEVLHGFHAGAARADGRALEKGAIYRIASMTKAVTAVLFLMLVEEGRVALDDPIASVLPELADLPVYAGGAFPPFATRPAVRQPTMFDLLTHTAGFTYGFQQHSPVDQAYWKAGVDNFRASITREGMLTALAGLPLLHDPGTHFTYSVATDLIGLIAERLTDRPLEEVFGERIFARLGMSDTGFALRAEQRDRLTDAWAMHPRQGRYVYDKAEDSLWSSPKRFPSGGGGLLSTVADYHRFCRMLLGRGTLDGERLLRAETVERMTRNHLPGGSSMGAMSVSKFAGPPYYGTGQGLGIAVSLPGAMEPWPGGSFHWSGLFSSWYSVTPESGLILIFMTQIIPLVEDPLIADVHRILQA
ncbi:MAG TPA: serine hydrolase domain-containing protein [Sphingobium sp.]|uniref:serine hydrolase domain-containing protein n=1 Tax=Sphingobium sp. TaxID=1912891 RepID=UPI002ED5AF68